MLAEQIERAIEEAEPQYHRLVLVVAAAGAGKSAALRRVGERRGYPCLNVNLELSRRLLELSERQRALQARGALAELVEGFRSPVVLLDNLELLFSPELRQNPLALLQALSRNTTIVAAWNGAVASGHLTYAQPGHPEYRRYPIAGVRVVTPESGPIHAPGPASVGEGWSEG